MTIYDRIKLAGMAIIAALLRIGTALAAMVVAVLLATIGLFIKPMQYFRTMDVAFRFLGLPPVLKQKVPQSVVDSIMKASAEYHVVDGSA